MTTGQDLAPSSISVPAGATLVALVFVACARRASPPPVAEEARSSVPDASLGDVATPSDAARPSDASRDASAFAKLPDDALLTIEYGECAGSCRPYRLTLAADGAFRGGRAPKTLGIAATQSVFALADEAFQSPPRCAPAPNGVQVVTITYRRGGETSAAQHVSSASCTTTLDQLERRMNALR